LQDAEHIKHAPVFDNLTILAAEDVDFFPLH
jgi:hypothetical protein